MSRRGALLLEAAVALAIFTVVGLLVLSTVRDGVRSLERVHQREYAVDLARSAMARMDAGIASIEELDGPVAPWDGGEGETSVSFDQTVSATVWRLEIDVEVSEFADLSLVTVRVFHDDLAAAAVAPDVGTPALYELRQLVRISESYETDLLPEDEITETLRRDRSRVR